MIVQLTAKDIDEQPELTFDEANNGEVEYSQWQDRDRIWWANRGSRGHLKL